MAIANYGGQDEFGGHSFFHEDGTELYVPDSPEARQIAMRLQSAPQPEMEARAPSLSRGSYGGGISAPPPPPVEKLDAGVSAVFDQYKAPAPSMGATQQPPDLPGVSAPGEPGAAPADATGLSPQEEALINRPNAGGGGVSQAQIQKKAAQGVPVPTGLSVEQTGAIPQNPEIDAAWVGAKKAEFDAQRTIAERNLEVAEAQRLGAQQQRAQLEYQAGIDAVRRQAIQDEAQRKIQTVQDFDTEAQARYADFGPDRYFKQKGTWAVIGAAIMQGLGAYAAIKGNTQNWAFNIIQAQKDADVQAQRDEYMRDKDARNNLVADIARATGDLDVATEAAKAIQMNIMASHAAEMAALSKRTDVANNWELWQAQFQAGVVDHMQKAYERGLGNTVVKAAAQYQYPQAASGGGPLTIEQLAKREEAGTRVVEARRKRSNEPGQLTHAQKGEVAKVGAETEAREKAKKQSELTESAAGLSTTLQSVKRMRELNNAESRLGVGGFGTDDYAEAQALVEDTILSYAKIKTGGVVTESDKLNARAVVPDPTSVRGRVRPKLDALEKRAKQEYVNKVRAIDPSARKKKPSQILLEAGVQASPDKEDKELE